MNKWFDFIIYIFCSAVNLSIHIKLVEQKDSSMNEIRQLLLLKLY